MPAILSQDPNGRWTIKNIRHMTNIPGLKIPATFIYRGPGAETMSEEDRMVKIPNGIEFAPKTVSTNWYTTPGNDGKLKIVPMQSQTEDVEEDDVERVYSDVLYGGYTYKVTKEIFEVNAYSGGSEEETLYLNVSKTSVDLASGATSTSIAVITNAISWTPSVTEGNQWLSVEKTDSGIKITATANTGASRDGTVKVVGTSGTSTVTKTVSVTQAKKNEEQTPYIELSISNYGSQYTADTVGETVSLSVQSNTGWTLSKSNNVSWVTIKNLNGDVVTGGTDNASLFVTIGEYTSTSQNRGMTISGITNGANSVYDTVKITQLKGSDTCTQETAPCDTAPCDTAPCDTAPCDTAPCDCDDECTPYSPCDTAPCDTAPCDTAPCDTAPCSCDDEIAPCPEDCYVERNGNIYLEKAGYADESHELLIDDLGASAQTVTYKVWTDTTCRVVGITAATQNDTAFAEFFDENGETLMISSEFGPHCNEKVEFTVAIPKNLANVDQEYKIKFEALNSNEKATAIFRQERKRVIGREDYEIENFWIRDASSPEQYVPADEAYYMPFVEVMCTERYNNGDSFETDVTDYWNNGAIDENKLTITTNDTTNCIILDDVGHGGGYQASPEYPFKIYLRANSGTTGAGSERHINLTLTYTNGGMETVSKTIEIIQAYQMVIPEENDVQFYYQGEYLDEIEADTRVNESFTVTVAKGTAGSTKLYVISPDGANLPSHVSNVTLAGVTLTEDDLDHHDGIIMQESSVIFTFNRDVPYEFSIGILVEEPGKEDKQLLVEFPSLN